MYIYDWKVSHMHLRRLIFHFIMKKNIWNAHCIKAMFGSSLPSVVCDRTHVLLRYLYLCLVYLRKEVVQHILWCGFFSSCCQFLWIVNFWLPLRYSLKFIVLIIYVCSLSAQAYWDKDKLHQEPKTTSLHLPDLEDSNLGSELSKTGSDMIVILLNIASKISITLYADVYNIYIFRKYSWRL